MRKIKVFNMISIDGYFASKDGSIDWHKVDDEFNKFALEMMEGVDSIMFGRVTYEMFESYWPAARKDTTSTPEELKIAEFIDDAKKYVFSKDMTEVRWKNTTLLHDINAEEINRIKNEAGKDIIIYGSGTVVQALTNLGLLDEYNLMVNPVILGKGKNMFANVNGPKNLQHTGTRDFAGTGNVLLTYRLV